MVAEALDRTGWAAELYDARWRVAHYSREWRVMVGDPPDDLLGYGLHTLEAWSLPAARAATPDARVRWMRRNLPFIAHGTPGGADAVLAMLEPDLRAAVGRVRAAPPPPLWSGDIEYLGAGLPPARFRYLTSALHRPGGGQLGWLTVYGPDPPASVASLVVRGRVEHFARMAALLRPARHETALLFADIQSSGTLSRHSSTAGWFAFIRAFTTAVDDIVIDHGGVVGRHAGDGVTAFFLADQLGSREEACAAAVRSALGIARWRAEAGPGTPADPVLVNAGLHWGGALYLGQLVTGGRLEVTALGDEVNECARIQETARDGALLASKPLVERLAPADAEAVGLDPLATRYAFLSELPGVSEKARRDAGTVPVVALAP